MRFCSTSVRSPARLTMVGVTAIVRTPFRAKRLRGNDQGIELARVEGDSLGAIRPDDNRVRVAKSRQTRHIESRLDREDHVFLDDGVVAAFVDEGPFVPLESQAVSGVMPLQIGDSEVDED